MALQLLSACEEWLPGIRDFNVRVRKGGMSDAFLLSENLCVPKTETPGIEKQQMILTEDEHVRAGVLLQTQPCWVNGTEAFAGNIQTPVSEGKVDSRYTHAAAIMMSQLQKRQPLLFAVGMGNKELPLPKLLTALKWRIEAVPFFFRVADARGFLTNIGPLRATPIRRSAAWIAANSGFGWLGVKTLRKIRQRTKTRLASIPVFYWDTWADELWNMAKKDYSFAGQKRAGELNALLSPGKDEVVAWRFEDQGAVVGWAAAMVHRLPDNKHFGDMVVGTLLDCFSAPGYEAQIAAAASTEMERDGAQILISNQNHRAWKTALLRSGYFQGPSNYLLATSPQLTRSIDFETAHVTRADGDGRVHL